MVPLRYNVRSLAARKATTFAAGAGVAAVVWIFSCVFMLSASIERTLGSSGSEQVAIVLRDGADAELSSGIADQDVGVALSAPQVRRREDGSPDGTSEVVGVLAVELADGSGGMSNMMVRGVRDDVYAFRPGVRIIAGERAEPGTDEAVIGSRLRGRFKGVDLGSSFELRRNRPVRIVGVFEDGGSSYESEVWMDVEAARNGFGRQGLVSAIRARLRSPADFDAFKTELEENPQLELAVEREDVYYEEASEGLSMFITVLGMIIAVLFALGAIIGAAITMYAAVASRSREIGALRALGFSRTSILFSFVMESVVLTTLGGLIGLLASLAMTFASFSTANPASWSEVVFTFEPTAFTLTLSLAFAIGMGLFGGFLPAVRAARMPILDALRSE